MVKYSIKDIKKNLDELNIPLASKLFSHPPGIVLVYLLANFTNITPNFLTLLSFVFRLSATYYILTNNFILVAVFAYLAHLLDSSDGILARTIGKTSKFGAAMDPLLDKIGHSLLFFVLTYKLFTLDMLKEAFIIFAVFLIYFNDCSFLGTCAIYKEEEKFVGKSKLESRIDQFKTLFSAPVFGWLLKKYVILMAKLKVNPIPSFIESYFLIFIIAPVFGFNYLFLLAGLIFYIPQFLFSFLRAVITIRKLK